MSDDNATEYRSFEFGIQIQEIQGQRNLIVWGERFAGDSGPEARRTSVAVFDMEKIGLGEALTALGQVVAGTVGNVIEDWDLGDAIKELPEPPPLPPFVPDGKLN